MSKKTDVPVATYVRRAGLDLGLDSLYLGGLSCLLFGAGGFVTGLGVLGVILILLAVLCPSKASLKELRAERDRKALKAG